jgi:hypothetical protein
MAMEMMPEDVTVEHPVTACPHELSCVTRVRGTFHGV